jgi:hypothetical protein
MGSPIPLIILAIIIPLLICILIIKYFLFPLFLKPKINTSEIIKFLNEKECSLVEFKTLNRKEKNRNIFKVTKGMRLKNITSVKSEYKIIGLAESENIYKIYWLSLQSFLLLFGKRSLNFIEEKDSEILNQIQKEYSQEIIKITNKCPACNNQIYINDRECENCGLNLITK